MEKGRVGLRVKMEGVGGVGRGAKNTVAVQKAAKGLIERPFNHNGAVRVVGVLKPDEDVGVGPDVVKVAVQGLDRVVAQKRVHDAITTRFCKIYPHVVVGVGEQGENTVVDFVLFVVVGHFFFCFVFFLKI